MSAEHRTASQPHPDIARGVAARAAQIGLMFAVLAVILFGAAGRLDWVWGWVYLAIYLAGTLVNAWFLLRRDPELVAERGQPGEMPGWDKALGGLWSLAQFVLLPLVAGLDERFGWTGQVGLAWHVAGVIVFAAGLALFGWAMITNAYFSTVARSSPSAARPSAGRGPIDGSGIRATRARSSSRSGRPSCSARPGRCFPRWPPPRSWRRGRGSRTGC
jgi:hypothetical protein